MKNFAFIYAKLLDKKITFYSFLLIWLWLRQSYKTFTFFLSRAEIEK